MTRAQSHRIATLYFAFMSLAVTSDLVADEMNGASDMFLHDRETGETERVSVASEEFVPPGRGLAMAAASPDEEVLKEEDARGKRARERRRAREHTEEDELLDALYADASKSLTIKAGGVCYAPVGSDEGSGFGAEIYRVRRDGRLVGGALWFAGSLKTPDVDVPIPHQDFTRRGYDSGWGLLYLFGRDDGRTALIGGIGPALVQVQYIDRSNVTGWTWDGGSRTVLGLQCQFGLLVHTGRRSAFRLGWDSQFGGFGGLSFGF
jgi:hypothetical protein